jgi:beta-glucosidase
MLLQFPKDFFWGTSTASAQIETASDHNWKGIRTKDGYIFDQTIDHEKQRDTDVDIIARFGNVYRCGVDWARLQGEPMGKFNHDVVEEYQGMFKQLNEKGIKIMFVLYHFSHPQWFEKKGAWLFEENAGYFSDFVKKCINNFGRYVSYWNTFNEPNAYAYNAYIGGNFPPFKRNRMGNANEVIQNMGIAHNAIYTMLKVYDKTKPVGISLFTAHFKGWNILGSPFATFADWWFHKRTAQHFEKTDFWGLSYYGLVPFTPLPVSEIMNPGKLAKMGLIHDKIWAYDPKGFLKNIKRIYKRYQKPIIITENGICTDDDAKRIQAIKDYLQVVHTAINQGVDIKGYIHWSTFDNFEWNLGPTYRFGLVRVNLETMERVDTEAAQFYEAVTRTNSVDL